MFYLIIAFVAGIFTWLMTLFGASLILFFKKIPDVVLSVLLGFSAGIMLSASLLSLLLPSIEKAESLGQLPVLVVIPGFLLGGLFLYLSDKLIPRLKGRKNRNITLRAGDNKAKVLVTAMVVGNIPEALSIGIILGALGAENSEITLVASLSLILGLGIQDFTDGAAISLELLGDGLSKKKAFLMGQLCGMLNPLVALLGAFLALSIVNLLPSILSLASGAMLYIVIEQIIPDAEKSTYHNVITLCALLGFALMMALEFTLG